MAPSPDDLPSVPDTLVGRPIDWFLAHHRRSRQVCELIDDLAEDDAPDAETTRLVLDYLTLESPEHLADEEQQLFPMLRRCCNDDDGVDPLLLQLIDEHRSDARATDEVVACLRECLASGFAVAPEARERLHAFAAHERRHLALENAVVLPFARLRLSTADLAAMSEAIARRRGLTQPRASR